MEKSSATKADILEYLQQAKEIEQEIFELEQMREEAQNNELQSRNEAKELEEQAEHCRDQAQIAVSQSIPEVKEKITQELNKIDNPIKEGVDEPNYRRKKHLPKDYKDSSAVGEGHVVKGWIYGIASIVLGIVMICSVVGDHPDDHIFVMAVGMLLIFGALPIGIIAACVAKKNKKSELADADNEKDRAYNERLTQKYKDSCDEYDERCRQRIEKYTNQITELQNEADQYIEHANALMLEAAQKKQQAEDYVAQDEQLAQNLVPLYANRKKFYSVGIVPPDYCTRDCVRVLYDVFFNDLADTMREGVLLYNQQVFRQGVDNRIKTVSKRIGILLDHMSSIRYELPYISVNVRQINDNNLKLVQNIMKNNDMLYAEAQMHRQAVEELERAQWKIAQEAEMQRRAVERAQEKAAEEARYYRQMAEDIKKKMDD